VVDRGRLSYMMVGLSQHSIGHDEVQRMVHDYGKMKYESSLCASLESLLQPGIWPANIIVKDLDRFSGSDAWLPYHLAANPVPP
jgi:hypothetical protein